MVLLFHLLGLIGTSFLEYTRCFSIIICSREVFAILGHSYVFHIFLKNILFMIQCCLSDSYLTFSLNPVTLFDISSCTLVGKSLKYPNTTPNLLISSFAVLANTEYCWVAANCSICAVREDVLTGSPACTFAYAASICARIYACASGGNLLNSTNSKSNLCAKNLAFSVSTPLASPFFCMPAIYGEGWCLAGPEYEPDPLTGGR